MSPRLRLPPVLFVALLLHVAVAPDLRVVGVAPNVLLLVAVAAGIVAGAEWGAKVGFAAGVLADLFLVRSPLGLSALTFSLTGYAVGGLQAALLSAPWWMAVASAAGGSALGTVLFGVVGPFVGQPALPAADLLRVAVVVAAANAALSVVAVPVLRWAIGRAGASGVVAG